MLRLLTIFFAVVAIILGILLYKATEKQDWFTEAEIIAGGGKALKISEDRPFLEYFDYGDPKGELILALHGHTTDGTIYEPFNDFFKKNHFRVISPSIPGWGLSSADTLLYLPQFAETMAVLMNHVAPGKYFSILGVSMGGLHAAAVASILHNRVINVNLVAPLGVSDEKHQPFINVPRVTKFLVSIMNTPYISDLFSYYITAPMVNNDFTQFLAAFSPEDWENTEDKERYTANFNKYFSRSIKTRLGHQRMMGMLLSEIDKNRFSLKDVGKVKGKVFVTMGTRDKIVAPNNSEYYVAEIPGSVLVKKPYSHMDMAFEVEDSFLQMMGKENIQKDQVRQS